MNRIVLGFSGGVDSSVSALLLQQEGYEVIPLYLFSGNDLELEYARETASDLGLELNCLDILIELEKNVCLPFAGAYLRGETPNPCIMCNPSVKFKSLLDYADKFEAEYIATGHYARAENGKIFKGQCENDQSYMLCRITREQASRLVLPLGKYKKSEVRSIAEKFQIKSAYKPDSMEICFIPNNDYIGWIEERVGKNNVPPSGDFIFNETIIGKHNGIHHYTVGQRRAGLLNERKVYISRIHPEDNSIELSLWENLFKNVIHVRDFSWLIDPPSEKINASVKVRHTKWENPKCVAYLKDDYVEIQCEESVRAPAPGQSAVLYGADGQLLGGGYII